MRGLQTRWPLKSSPWLCGCLGLFALAVIGNGVARAQAPIKQIKFADRKKDRFAVEQLLRSEAEIPIKDEEKFDGYFQQFVLPPLANPDADLPAVRNEIKRNFRTAVKGLPYARLNAIVRDFANFTIRSREVRHPACRVNAILVLGDLNEFEGEGSKLAKPLPEALDDLVALLKMPKLPDYMRVAALVGVQRHALMSYKYPLEQNVQEEISKQMFELLAQKEPPGSRAPSAQAYLRLTAAEILGLIGNPGKNGEIAVAVVDAMNEKDAPLSMRLGMCNVIGMFKYNPAVKVDYKSAAVAVCRTLVDATQRELDRAEILSQQKQTLVDPDRRRLAYIFRQAWLALFGDRRIKRTGIIAAATEAGRPEAETLTRLFNLVSKTLSELDNPAAIVDSVDIADKLAAIKETLPIQEAAQPNRPAPSKLPADLSGAKKVAAGAKSKTPAEPANR